MKFPYSMLLDFVQTSLSAQEVGDLLTMAGFELEGIETVEGDEVLDIKVVSNRGDGLSVYGLSREIMAKDLEAAPTDLYRAASARFEGEDVSQDLQLQESVATIEAEACHRFACRAFEGIDAASSSPAWMQLRLRQAGMRPISLLVDLTNYVMLELGQPLHAFDWDKLVEGRIVVRHALPGENLTTLNGVDHQLDGQMMICDAARPVGVPGVMGGLETEVTDATQRVLLESANFRNTAVRKTRNQLGLNTEASYRFERSVDPDGVVAAIRRFTDLLRQSAPSVKTSNIVDHYPTRPVRTPVRLRVDRASRLLGMTITQAEASEYLSRLGMNVEATEDSLIVSPPTWRPDIVREEDLVEELGRIHGYERIPEMAPQGTTTPGGSYGRYLRADRLRDAALRAGFVEIVSHSLRDEHVLEASAESRVRVRVPASPEHAVLRDSLLPCLADAAQRNGGKDLHLFEIGRIFRTSALGAYLEESQLALLSTGALLASDRKGRSSEEADFYSLKGVVDELVATLGAVATFAADAIDPRLHPTRQATILVGDENVGVIGQLHPEAAQTLRLAPVTLVAEIAVDRLLQLGVTDPVLRPISRNPAVRRDITIAISREVAYEAMAKAVHAACGPLLERLWLVDDYMGPGVPENQHALTFGLSLRKVGENFTDEEANQVRDEAVAALVRLGGTTR